MLSVFMPIPGNIVDEIITFNSKQPMQQHDKGCDAFRIILSFRQLRSSQDDSKSKDHIADFARIPRVAIPWPSVI